MTARRRRVEGAPGVARRGDGDGGAAPEEQADGAKVAIGRRLVQWAAVRGAARLIGRYAKVEHSRDAADHPRRRERDERRVAAPIDLRDEGLRRVARRRRVVDG